MEVIALILWQYFHHCAATCTCFHLVLVAANILVQLKALLSLSVKLLIHVILVSTPKIFSIDLNSSINGPSDNGSGILLLFWPTYTSKHHIWRATSEQVRTVHAIGDYSVSCVLELMLLSSRSYQYLKYYHIVSWKIYVNCTCCLLLEPYDCQSHDHL